MNRKVTTALIKSHLNYETFFREYVQKFHLPFAKAQATGLCPFHEDSNPSLQMNVVEGVFNCFSCGKQGDIFNFYMYKHNVSFPEAKEALAKRIGLGVNGSKGFVKSTNNSKVVDTRHYRDKDGTIIYSKDRVEPGRDGKKKEFFFFHNQDGQQKRGRGTESILYRLPDVLSADPDLIIAEGEAKADLFAKQGFRATSLDSGVGSKLSAQMIEQSAGKTISLFPDNDKPGELYMEKLAISLNGKAKSIKIVHLPELPPKGDIIDFLEDITDFDPKEITDLIQSTPKWEPKPNSETCDDVLKLEAKSFDSKDWLEKSGLYALEKSPDYSEVGKVMEWMSNHSSGLTEIHSEIIKLTTISHLKSLGCTGASSLVQKALKQSHSNQRLPGQEIKLELPKPWLSPVDGAEVLKEMRSVLRTYLVQAKGADLIEALWDIHTYIMPIARHTPKLLFKSPDHRCGKTISLNLNRKFCCKALLANKISPAAVYRTIDEYAPTLLIDEADTFLPRNHELTAIINSSHFQDEAFLVGLVPAGDGWLPRRFSTWCPIAIASKGKDLEATIEDRSIIIPMSRKKVTDQVEQLPDTQEGINRLDQQQKEITRKITRWVGDNGDALKTSNPKVPSYFNDREKDSWKILFKIADVMGKEVFEELTEVSQDFHKKDEDESREFKLLTDIRTIFNMKVYKDAEKIPSWEIVQHLEKMEDRPWPELSHGKPITPHKMAKMLKNYKIEPKLDRTGVEPGEDPTRGYYREDFHEAWDRYLEPLQTLQPNNDRG